MVPRASVVVSPIFVLSATRVSVVTVSFLRLRLVIPPPLLPLARRVATLFAFLFSSFLGSSVAAGASTARRDGVGVLTVNLESICIRQDKGAYLLIQLRQLGFDLLQVANVRGHLHLHLLESLLLGGLWSAWLLGHLVIDLLVLQLKIL